MRRTKTFPQTDLEKFHKEVLSRGIHAALPQNLPDRWLRLIGRDMVRSQKADMNGFDDPSIDISTPVLIVSYFLSRKAEFHSPESGFSSEELMDGIDKFWNAIPDEIIGRETGMFLRQYTVDNIV